ncbi:MAG: hypothetical protein GY873_09070 [Bosea sp.]|uniref:hypothetical protein n=1 Tax=Bosea sp. (in: a-proteobacteria) TaxID=1871050 RepID=UPI0023862C18|nr:hypothetical protein [Bosea sp. (in: a-proteobacteria)]MCP4734331.1 hypothetical protein [Bosea sp. (in: a-proteobacteria)]
MALHPSSRLLVLACSATKRDGQSYMPAIQRYDGPLWQTLRAVDPYGEKAKVAFLSAHLGFCAASSPIESYNALMSDQMAAAMKAGDLGTRWPRPDNQQRGMPSGEHPGVHIASLTSHKRCPFSDVALAGGHLYLDVMRHLVDLFRIGGYVVGDAQVCEINGPIGQMRRDLRLWLDGDDGEGH